MTTHFNTEFSTEQVLFMISNEFPDDDATATEKLNYTSALFNLWHEMAETYLNDQDDKINAALEVEEANAENEDLVVDADHAEDNQFASFMNGKRLDHLHMAQVIATNGCLLENPKMDETVAKRISQHIDSLEGTAKWDYVVSLFKLWASLTEIAIGNREVELENAEDNAETDFECFLNGKRIEAMEAMGVAMTNGYLLES